MNAILEAIQKEKAAEVERHEQTMAQIGELEAKARELSGEPPPDADADADAHAPHRGASSQSPDTDRGEPEPAAPPAQPKRVGNEKKALALLTEGPATRIDLIEKAGIPSGSIGSVVEAMQRKGLIVRHDEKDPRTGRPTPVFRLADDPGSGPKAAPAAAEPATNANGAAQDPALVYRVLEVVAHARMGAAGIAGELDAPVSAVALALNQLEEAGDVTCDGNVYVMAA